MGPGFAVADVIATCRWCGDTHGPLCPYVKALEFDQTNHITRVEFLTPADYQRLPPADTVAVEYPKKPGG